MPELSPQPERYALTGALVFDGRALLPGKAVIIARDAIEAISPDDALPSGLLHIHTEGAIISPGFVDLQVNGCGGVMFNGAVRAETLKAMCRANLKSGCTAFMPTLISTSDAEMRAAMRLVAACREGQQGPVMGLHLEGPYINTARRGIHDAAHIRPLDAAMRDELCAYARRTPLMLTLAPECVSEEDITELARAGVVVSIGHSDASYAQTMRGIAAGARAGTHLFNAMSPWRSREPGVVGALLNAPNLPCGIIVDGQHAHFASVALAKGLKGESLFLVTDATAPAGTDMKEFDFCGQTVHVRDGKCLNADGTLGGAALTMPEALRNAVRHAGIALEEALRMATLYPARLMGREGEFGRIAPGRMANLALFSADEFAMKATVDRGKLYTWEKRYG